MKRTGNLLTIVGGAALEPMLADRLKYWHKTFYQGPQLRAREKWLKDQQEYKMHGSVYDTRIDTGEFNPKIEFTSVKQYHITPEGDLSVPAGLRHRLVDAFNGWGIRWQYQDLRSKRLPPFDWKRLWEVP